MFVDVRRGSHQPDFGSNDIELLSQLAAHFEKGRPAHMGNPERFDRYVRSIFSLTQSEAPQSRKLRAQTKNGRDSRPFFKQSCCRQPVQSSR
ncbi:hypothetical protein AB6802_14085 [Mesorhizobium sp. RCC_202]|uniref:hypothetical protein n=1 Tax=Mesorhizobium sp. RCC_202 TaxID=3239222 RepID=UPI003525421B